MNGCLLFGAVAVALSVWPFTRCSMWQRRQRGGYVSPRALLWALRRRN